MEMEMENRKKIVSSGNSVILDLENKDIIEYEVFVDVVIQTWNENIGFGKFHFYASVLQFREIMKNPLQDYASFGVRDVLYAYVQYVPVFWKDGMEITDWNDFGYTYAFGENYKKYEKEINEIIKEMEEMDYTNINYHE